MDPGSVTDFLDRARREAERYGDDPWILLRELVQNSRDAGATAVRFSAEIGAEHEVLSCVDDGAGMSRGDIERYLLRLYASGKDARKPRKGARAMTGKFGVGFWSVLRFEPSSILVETDDGSGASAVEVDCVSSTIREVYPMNPPARGTRVTLKRPRRKRALDADVRAGLIRWASHVRGVGGGPPPELSLGGERLNRDFPRPRLIAERVRDRGFDGIIGFGNKPDIRLYAHGFLVKSAGSLEELLPKRRARKDETAPGLYPVCFLNADALEVLMDRSSVSEDAVLERVVRGTERRLHRLRLRLLDEMGPLPLLEKLRLKLVRPSVLAALLLAVVSFAGSALGARWLNQQGLLSAPAAVPALGPRPAERSGPRTLAPDLLDAEAPRISSFDAADILPWDLRVSDPRRRFLKMATFARFDARRGLVRAPPNPRRLARLEGARGRDPTVELGARHAGAPAPLVLPIPSTGEVLEPVTVDGVPAAVALTDQQEPVVRLEAGAHSITYRFRDRGARGPLPVGATATRFPPRMQRWIDEARRLPAARRPAHLQRRVAEAFTYSISAADAAAFDQLGGDFLARVDAFGRGDCDVLNAVLVLLLRAVGVPANLAVGLVVEDGAAARELHAWVEHYAGGAWSVLDVTPATFVPTAAAAAPAGPTELIDEGPRPTGATGPGAAVDTPVADAPDAVDALDDDGPNAAPAAVDDAAPRAALDPAVRARLRRAFPWLLGLTLGLALLVLVLFLRRARRPRDIPRDDPALIEMLRQFLQNRSGPDPLHLARRRFFRTAGGRALSVERLDESAWSRPLLVAAPGSPALPHVVSDQVLDATDGLLNAVRDLLPDAVDLDALVAPRARPPRDPALRVLERAVHRLDPGCAVSESDDDEILEAAVRTRAPQHLPPRHLVVGRGALPPPGDEGHRALHLARAVLRRTTLLRDHEERLLALVAWEALQAPEAVP